MKIICTKIFCNEINPDKNFPDYGITTFQVVSIMYADQYLIHKVSYYSRAVLKGSKPSI